MENKPGYAKIILIVVFIASVASSIHQYKVPPVMKEIMQALSISLGASGWLMSVFALVGIILALPSGIFLQRLGYKATALIAVSSMIIGSAVGIFSVSAPVMLFSRVIEGVGMCLITVMAPAAISAWFPPEKRGLPMGIWATWGTLGCIIMFNIAPELGTFGWKAVWSAATLFSAAAFILVAFLFYMPEGGAGTPQPYKSFHVVPDENPYLSPQVWLVAFQIFILNVMALAVGTYMPVYLETVIGLNQVKASSTASLPMVASFIAAPLTGFIISLVHAPKKALIAGMFLACVVMLLLFSVRGPVLYVLLIFNGVSFGVIASSALMLVPVVTKNPAKIGTSMAIVMFGQNIGMFIGPVLFGTLAEAAGWEKSAYALAILTGLGAISAFFIRAGTK